MKKLVLLGAPGVGKGTFASIIAPKLNFSLVSVGDRIRDEIKQRTTRGLTFKQYTEKGKLVPDELVSSMVHDCLFAGPQMVQSSNEGIILDGFPRTLAQAESLTKISEVDGVINICLEEWVAVKKILGRRVCGACKRSFNVASVMTDGFDMPALPPDFDRCPGPLSPAAAAAAGGCPRALERRADDTEAVVRERFRVYGEATAPLVRYYEDRGLLHNFYVTKGIKDTDRLIQLILSTITSSSTTYKKLSK